MFAPMKIFLPLVIASVLSLTVADAQDTNESARARSEKAERIAEEITETLTPDADARKVAVNLTADRIDMPKSVPPSRTAFVVKNVGREKQNFEVEGERIEKKFRLALAPQETKVFQMTLKPGQYKAYCTALDGTKRRMEVNMTVR